MIAWDYDNPLSLAEGESPKANQALNDYALLGPGRSLSQLAEQYRRQHEGGSVPTRQQSTLARWSAEYSWQERVTTYDEQQRHAAREAAEQATIAGRLALQETIATMADKLLVRVSEMLAFPLAQVDRTDKVSKAADGRTTIIQQTIIKPARWGFRDAAQIGEIAVKLKRIELDLQSGAAVDDALAQLTEADLDAMSLAEMLELREKVAKRGKR